MKHATVKNDSLENQFSHYTDQKDNEIVVAMAAGPSMIYIHILYHSCRHSLSIAYCPETWSFDDAHVFIPLHVAQGEYKGQNSCDMAVGDVSLDNLFRF